MKFLSLLAVLGLSTISAQTFPEIQPVSWLHAVRQWEDAAGYCGETSLQQAGLFYGQYNSQGVIRAAYGSGSQSASNQLLIGDSSKDAAVFKKLKFTYELWDWQKTKTPQATAHLKWIQGHLNSGHPTIFTIYLNTLKDEDYDHIVLAVGYDSSKSSFAYYEFDTTDHWFTNWPTYPTNNADGIVATRKQCSGQSKSKYCLPYDYDYGAAITGIIDTKQVTVPVHMQISQIDEPNWVYKKAKPTTIYPDLTAVNLKSNTTYIMLSYNSYSKVPDSGFNASQADGSYSFTPLTSQFTFQDSNGFLSDGSRYYRCVPASAVADAHVAQPVPLHAIRTPRLMTDYQAKVMKLEE